MFEVSRVVRFTAVSLAALCVSAAVAGAGAADPLPPFPPDQNQLPSLPTEPQLYDALPIPVPAEDPWYNDPPNLADYAPGEIIRSRTVQTRLLGIPFPVDTRQLLYRTNDVHDNPIATATSVITPGIPWHGSPRPVISFQEAIDSTDSACNPSYTLQTGTMKEAALAQFWLAQGFAINVPDFDGKFNTFNTYDEGKMVLDSLRAMKSEPTLGLTDSGIALYGYSGGGSGSLRAAELRETYAPDVRLLGTAVGGMPADLIAQARYAVEQQPGLTGISNFTMWLGFAALSREFPDAFDAEELLTDDGQRILREFQSRCVYTIALTGMYRPISDYFRPGKSLETSPEVQAVLTSQSLGKHIPDTPVFWWHGIWDELIPPAAVLPVVNDYWHRGADLRFYTMPLPEHIVNAGAGWPPAVAWTSAVLRGLPPGPRFKADFGLPGN
ncbi:lipase family protein [Nocardia sp. NPDC059180]|uniref:lipase family protein n=1 Tax=Nocardia sp. NPDC059180 TaxID=3346761 RepID=UPI00367991F1